MTNRECSDPMCACRGGPCAECEEGQRGREIEDLRFSLDFYQRRCESLQSWQSKMRDPERTIVCDILANGFTLDPAFAGDRYTAPPQRKPLTDEQVESLIDGSDGRWHDGEFRIDGPDLTKLLRAAHGISELYGEFKCRCLYTVPPKGEQTVPSDCADSHHPTR